MRLRVPGAGYISYITLPVMESCEHGSMVIVFRFCSGEVPCTTLDFIVASQAR